ncbi:MAG: HAD-IA family hydrolase [Methanoregula sp.]|uniref:HAD family hydrolase n=1 Tax=Methanoregula sp. TaxID=2052170 RepID=UPI003C1B2E8B
MNQDFPHRETRKRPVNAILFDMDNTLFDLVGAQVAACDCVVRHLGHDDGDDLFSYFLNTSHGFESTENIRQYMQERQISTNGMYEKACRIYATEKLRHIIPYPGVTKTLREIRKMGFATGIVTDAERVDAIPRLSKCELSSLFDCMVTFDLVKIKKPAPAPFLTALDTIHARPEDAIFIGDSPRRDIEPCKKLGIRTVYARYGDRFSKTRDYSGADFVIDRMDELLGIVKSLPAS